MTRRAARLAAALSLALASTAPAQHPAVPGSPPVSAARELRRIPAAEARQAVAADEGYLYAIDNRAIGRYDRRTGQRVGGWAGPEDGPIQHLNSGVVVDGRLYAAHSNYPELPMVSSIEVWDVATMRHVASHSFGVRSGSATWVDRHQGSWWVTFANYENRAGEPGRGVAYTTLERFDDQWRPTGGWVLPPALLPRLRPYSVSGGFWTPDGRLLLTGHDAPELYLLRLPDAGSVLHWDRTITGPHQGQGIARHPTDPTVVFGIDRARKEIVEMKVE